jgi:hypothetical protein
MPLKQAGVLSIPNSASSKRVNACSIVSSFKTLPPGTNQKSLAGRLTRLPNKNISLSISHN